MRRFSGDLLAPKASSSFPSPPPPLHSPQHTKPPLPSFSTASRLSPHPLHNSPSPPPSLTPHSLPGAGEAAQSDEECADAWLATALTAQGWLLDVASHPSLSDCASSLSSLLRLGRNPSLGSVERWLSQAWRLAPPETQGEEAAKLRDAFSLVPSPLCYLFETAPSYRALVHPASSQMIPLSFSSDPPIPPKHGRTHARTHEEDDLLCAHPSNDRCLAYTPI